MRYVEPSVHLIASPTIAPRAIREYLEDVGGEAWIDRIEPLVWDQQVSDGEALVEFAGKLCYRAWEPGLNPNVTKVRDDNAAYLANIVSSLHGSVTEHAQYTFVLHNVSRIVTHELTRHRAGAAYCLDGETEITIQTDGNGRDRITLQRVRIKDLHDRWHKKNIDSMGRQRFLPASRQRTLRVLNEDTQTFQMAKLCNVWEAGKKETIRISVAGGGPMGAPTFLICTPDHAVYTDDGWVKAGDLSIGDRVAVTGKRNIAPPTHGFTPRLRSAIGLWTSKQREILIQPVDQCYVCREFFDIGNLELDHIIPVVQNLAKALDINNLAPVCRPCHFVKTGKEQPSKTLVAGSKFTRVIDIQPAGERTTYDLEVEGPWNNFLANGIVVHNSQESMRYVRLTDIPIWIPQWARQDHEFMRRAEELLTNVEQFQVWMADHWGLDGEGIPFSEKKAKTSFMRRFSPGGVATGIVFSANVRALRHIIELRTSLAAEEEIRIVFDKVGEIMRTMAPNLFADFEVTEDREWIPKHRKI